MKRLLLFFPTIHILIALLFVVAALSLIVIAAGVGLASLVDGFSMSAAQGVIEMIGLAAHAVVALQIAQTIVEEEAVRRVHLSGGVRIRRYVSRFMAVIVIALAVEGLVATFKALHENMGQLPHAASLVVAVGVTLAGWGLFSRFSQGTEEAEHEAAEQAERDEN